MPTTSSATRERIRELNDALRTSLDPTLGKFVLTSGVDSLPSDVRAMVVRKVATFVAFTGDNDPHNEHDFGSFEIDDQKFIFKHGLYEEPGVKGLDEAPIVTRVLIIMLADEY